LPARVRRDFLAILDLLTRGLTRVLAHQVIIGESQLVCAGALLVQTRLGALALGPGRRQPRTMIATTTITTISPVDILSTSSSLSRRLPANGPVKLTGAGARR
jgi:hypothetical protein